MSREFDRFQVVDDRRRELTRLDADVMLYFDYPLSEVRDDLLGVMESFYDLCPRSGLRWYLTETMKQFKPATARSFTLPAVWWKDGVPRSTLRELHLKDGEQHDSVATCGLSMSSAERSHRIFSLSANYLRFIVPPELAETGHQRLVDFVIYVCDRLPFVSGHAGYVIECNRYFANAAEAAAFPLAMRHQGVDIATMSPGPWAVRHERIKNVGWLTMVGAELLKKLGGLKALQGRASTGLDVIGTRHGVVVRAGVKPILGDVNRREDLRAYQDAYTLLEPAQAGVETLFAPFDVPDGGAATERWLFRFAKKGP